jgi:hypothetical protein
MIYWHVDKNSLCIHSQLKSPSSSEVASMIEGVVLPERAMDASVSAEASIGDLARPDSGVVR